MAVAVADAKARGTPEIYVWALPQVARDGFIYFEEEEEDVNAFDDLQFPLAIGLGASQSHKGIAAAFHRRIARRGALLQRQCQCALLII